MTHTGIYGDPCVEHHQVVIFDRGGTERVAQLSDIHNLEYNRELDRMTSAQVHITGRACRAQAATLGALRSRRHEAVIFRGTERVWEGPIVQTESTSDQFIIYANDVIEYLYGRPLTRAWGPADDSGATSVLMTEKLREVLTYEMTTDYEVVTSSDSGDLVVIPAWENVDPPANVVPFFDIAVGEDTLTRALTEAFQMSLGEYLSERGEAIGLSFCTVGRKLVIWETDIGRTRTLTEKDFGGDFKVIDSGKDYWSAAHVISTSTTDGVEPPVGHAVSADLDGTRDTYFGPWAKVVSTSSEDPEAEADPDTLRSQARASLKGRYPVPLEIVSASGSRIITSAGLTFNHLVPGTDMPVRASNNIRDVRQLQRLQSVNVKEDGNGEVITATLAPIGTAG